MIASRSSLTLKGLLISPLNLGGMIFSREVAEVEGFEKNGSIPPPGAVILAPMFKGLVVLSRQAATYFFNSQSVEAFKVSKSISIPSRGMVPLREVSLDWTIVTTLANLSPGSLLMSRDNFRFSS